MKKIIFIILCAMLTAASEPQPSKDRYAEIIKRGTIRIGISLSYPPLNFNSGEKGAEINLARGFAEFLGVKPVFVPLKVGEYADAVADGRADVIFAGLSRSLTRAKKIWFSKSYISITPGLLADRRAVPQTRFGDEFEQPPFKTIWDIRRTQRFRFAVKKGSSYEELIRTHFPGMKAVAVETNEEAIELLSQGKADGFVHDSLYLEYMYQKNIEFRKNYILLQGGNLSEHICAGIPFGDYILKNQIDTYIDEVIRTGKFNDWLKEFN